MKILFACGGTAGHINPALATANYIRSRYPDTQVLFIGSPKGMEARLVPEAGYDFAPVELKGIQRRLSWHNFCYNLSSMELLCTCWGKIRRILRQFQPDVVVGTGGYVSGPVLRQAARMGFRTVTHAYPGMTTRLIARTADKVLLAVPEAAAHLECRREPIVTGSPVREEILFADRAAAREKLGVGDRVCILSFGGSLGAERINRAMAEVVAHFAPTGRTHHIHATGAYGTELFPECLRELGADIKTVNRTTVDVDCSHIRNRQVPYEAADLVICRSGAMTLTELEAAGRASILIPSPNVAENHQYHNAMVLAEHGAAVVIEEKDLTGERLCQTIEELLSDPARLTELGKKAASLARLDANERISREILELAQEPAKA